MSVDLISVIVLSYNNNVNITVESVVRQDYPGLELIVIDDGSTKFNKQDLVNRLETNKKENLLRYQIIINDSNIGTVRSLNRAISVSTGKYIKIIAGDDYLKDTTALSVYYQTIISQSCDAVVSRILFCSENGCFESASCSAYNEMNNEELYKKLIVNSIISAPAVLIKRELVSDKYRFDEHYRLVEDWPQWIKLIKDGKKFYWMEDILVSYQMNGVSQTKGKNNHYSVFRDDLKYLYETVLLKERHLLSRYQRRVMEFYYNRRVNWMERSSVWKMMLLVCYVDVFVCEILIKHKISKGG